MVFSQTNSILISILFVILLTAGASACAISVSGLEVSAKGDNDTQFNPSITASKNSDISIRMQFNIDSYTGTDCPTTISAQPIISRYNSTTSTWEQYKTSSTKSQTLSQDTVTLTWTNEFNTGSDDKYTRFKIEGDVLNNGAIISSQYTYVEIQDNSCSGIKVVTNDVSIDEGTTTARTFYLQNNTSNSFNISNVGLYFTNSLINSGTTNYNNYVPAHSQQAITINLGAGYVSSTTTTTGTLRISGNLNGTTCSESDIGVKYFDVTVNNTGINDSSNNYYDGYYGSYATSSDCSSLEIHANDVSIQEGTNTQTSFYLKNDSAQRFSITGMSVTSNGADLSAFAPQTYAYANGYADILLTADAPLVTTTQTRTNTIKVKGTFSDGRTCNYSDIASEDFALTINNAQASQTNTLTTNCAAFSLSVPGAVSGVNYANVPMTLVNGTNKSATVYVEGADASPSIIVIPATTSLLRDIAVTLASSSAQTLTLRPVVEGCSLASSTTVLTNTAQGNLSALTMTSSVSTSTDDKNTTLMVEINNPTNKVFVGTLHTQLPAGWSTSQQNTSLNVVPGKNIAQIPLIKSAAAGSGKATVTFSADNGTIASDTQVGGISFAGLFSFGASAYNIAIIILVLLIGILIIGYLQQSTAAPQPKEPWEMSGERV